MLLNYLGRRILRSIKESFILVKIILVVQIYLRWLKSHLDRSTSPSRLNRSLRIMWRKKFKHLSSLEWKNNDDLNKALQEIETSYDYLRKISFSNIDGLSKTHYKFLFEQSKREEQVTGELSSEDTNNSQFKTTIGNNRRSSQPQIHPEAQ